MGSRNLASLILALSLAACGFVEPRKHMEHRRQLRASADYVPWNKALKIIEQRCTEIAHIYQGHDRIVLIVFGTGEREDDGLQTISPRIDQIFGVVADCHPDAERIPSIIE